MALCMGDCPKPSVNVMTLRRFIGRCRGPHQSFLRRALMGIVGGMVMMAIAMVMVMMTMMMAVLPPMAIAINLILLQL